MLGSFRKPRMLFCAKMARRHWGLILSSVQWESNNFLYASVNSEDQMNVICFKRPIHTCGRGRLSSQCVPRFSINRDSPNSDCFLAHLGHPVLYGRVKLQQRLLLYLVPCSSTFTHVPFFLI